jgi:hypothetical protein
MSLTTTEFVTNNNMVIVLHAPYSPDLAPCDFALFPKLKMKMRGQHFETVSDILRESQQYMTALHTFPSRLFWRKWQPELSKLSQHFFYDLVWKENEEDESSQSISKECNVDKTVYLAMIM